MNKLSTWVILLCIILFYSSYRACGQAPVFPLKISENGRYFVDQKNIPFFYQADTGWQIISRLTLQEAREYFVLRKQQGFTAIQIMLSINPDSVTRSGHTPFKAYDFSQPDEAYFSHSEQVIRIADSLQLLLTIAPFWTGCCKEGYGVGAKVEMFAKNGIAKTKKLGQWLGKRFGKYNHIFWIMGGDNDPLSIRKEIEALAEGIKSTAPQQLITFHARPPHSSTDLFQYAPWLNFSMIYTYWREKPNDYVNPEQMVEVYETALREYLKSDRMPFILGESQYEGSGTIYPNDMGSPHHIRRQAWWTMLCGGSGHAYGHDGWFFPANWRTIMQHEGASHLQHVIRFFQSIPWWQLVPDLRHQVLIHGYGEYTKSNYVTAAVTEDKRIFVAYLPQPGPLTIDLTKLKGPQMEARWYNPRTGNYTSAGSFPEQQVVKIYSPLQGDWVLIVSSK